MGKELIPTKSVHVEFFEKRNIIFHQIADVLMKGYSPSNLLFVNLLLPYYLTTFILPQQFQPVPVTQQSISPIDKSISFMQQNLSTSNTLKDTAQAAHLSVSFFLRKFRKETGYTPIDYFNYLRIQKACQLLHFSKLRINEVATEIGIHDPFYFSRMFKQQTGISPLNYRRNGERG